MTLPPERLRNTPLLLERSRGAYQRAIDAGLMQVTLRARDDRRVTLPDGREATEFVNCSYLGLDVRPDVVARAKQVMDEWGVHLCCARSRFSIGPLGELEAGLSELWGGHAITFPSVTTAHMSTMPLLATAGFGARRPETTFLYDRFAHASMRYLQPVLAAEHRVETLPHNDLEALEVAVKAAHARGDHVVYVADGIYSMGGVCPIEDVVALSRRLDFALYIDDAHGTSIVGDVGEGTVVSRLGGKLPENVTVAFSLSKGYGCNGGGVLLPTAEAAAHVRTFGQTYAFSAPLDFSAAGAALVVLELHRDGTVRRLQQTLRDKVALFDRLTARDEAFSPIRMVPIGDEDRAIDAAGVLVDRGCFTTVAFFPIVRRGQAQLRIALGVNHSDDDIERLANAVREVRAG